jgi:hypothetical protein
MTSALAKSLLLLSLAIVLASCAAEIDDDVVTFGVSSTEETSDDRAAVEMLLEDKDVHQIDDDATDTVEVLAGNAETLAPAVPHRPGWACSSYTGESCHIESASSWFGWSVPSFLRCAEGDCLSSKCTCGIGTCWDASKKKCVAWTPPNRDATKKDVDKILCPVLSSMYSAGDLVPDKDGMVSRRQLRDALMNAVGTSKFSSNFQATGVAAFDHDDAEMKDRKRCLPGTYCWFLNLFSVDDPAANRYLNLFNLGANKFVEHGASTGVREVSQSDPNNECKGKFPCEARFQRFYVANLDSRGRFYRANLRKVQCMAIKEGDKLSEWSHSKSQFLREWQLKLATNGWLDAFGRMDEETGEVYMTEADLRRMLMHGNYPEGWVRRPWGEPKSMWEAVTDHLACDH